MQRGSVGDGTTVSRWGTVPRGSSRSEMSDLRGYVGPEDHPDPERHRAAPAAGEGKPNLMRLWGNVVRHSLRAILGATPLVLGLLPQFRSGLILLLLVPLALLVVNEARRAWSAYLELQRARRSLRGAHPPRDTGEAP